MTCPLICGFLISFLWEIPKTTSYGILPIVLSMVMCFFTSGSPRWWHQWFGDELFSLIKLQRLSFVVLFACATIFFHCGNAVFAAKIGLLPWLEMMPCSWCILHSDINKLHTIFDSLYIIYACAKWWLSWRLGNSLTISVADSMA